MNALGKKSNRNKSLEQRQLWSVEAEQIKDHNQSMQDEKRWEEMFQIVYE